jgi:hypothetical protein
MIIASPGQPPTADQAEVVSRLIALLPVRAATTESTVHVLSGIPRARWTRRAANLRVIAAYIALMVLTQWTVATVFEKSPGHPSALPPAPATTADAAAHKDVR